MSEEPSKIAAQITGLVNQLVDLIVNAPKPTPVDPELEQKAIQFEAADKELRELKKVLRKAIA